MVNDTDIGPSGPRATLAILARSAEGGLISTPKAADALGLTRRTAVARLNRLVASGWLARARRGLFYILPLDSSAAESTTVEDPWVLVNQLLSPCYIGGWSAAEHWQLTEQLFRATFVVTAAGVRTRAKRVLGAEFNIVRVPKERIRGLASVWRGSVRVPVSDRERTIADALASPEWVGGVRHLIEIFVTYKNSAHFNASKLLTRVGDINRGSAYKRLGFLFEQLFGVDDLIVPACLEKKSAGVIKLDPAVTSRGKVLKRWGLAVNVRVEVT